MKYLLSCMLASILLLLFGMRVQAGDYKLVIERPFTNTVTYTVLDTATKPEITILEMVFPGTETNCAGVFLIGPAESQTVLQSWTNQLIKSAVFFFPQGYTAYGDYKVTCTNGSVDTALAILRIHLRF